ncbi:DUF1090 family protein [Helicobacter burdigaliensis]|uniref:DUF1090 family protein n=1 Tax=Helicobacter burdigaliensis TaxID=2315334 RepID=UPI000EF672CE|nr:DUF1090 family protein [Helicobacter burdigaliensis]
MKTNLKYLLLSLAYIPFLLNAGELCDQKTKIIQEKIKLLESYPNTQNKIEGLKIALQKHKRFCTDEKIIYEAKSKVAKLDQKIKEKEEDKKEAEFKGKSSKVAKLEQKIKELEEEREIEILFLNSLEKGKK